MSAKAKKVISQLFEAFMEDPKLMPFEAQEAHQELSQQDNDHGGARAIADYIAGMTDRFAILEYERVFNPSKLTLYSI
jgi:dGTPase